MYGQPMYGQPMMQPVMQPVVQPMYMPPPPPPQQGPTVITIGNQNRNEGTPCQFCGTSTGQIVRKKVGCVAIAWGLCLFWFTGILCCLPCCMDGCKDSELVCVKCQQVKNTIPANCCWNWSIWQLYFFVTSSILNLHKIKSNLHHICSISLMIKFSLFY